MDEINKPLDARSMIIEALATLDHDDCEEISDRLRFEDGSELHIRVTAPAGSSGDIATQVYQSLQGYLMVVENHFKTRVFPGK